MPEKMLRVYFSFDYERDIHRVNSIRQLPNILAGAAAGFQSNEVFEAAKRKGDPAVHGLVNDALNNTTVTVLCIGNMTAYRKYFNYELERSLECGNGLVGIRIHHLKDERGLTDEPGEVPTLLKIAGYKVYDYTDQRDLAQHIREAVDLAAEQKQREHQRRMEAHERKPE